MDGGRKVADVSFLWEDRGQGPGVREGRVINGNPSGRHEHLAGLGTLEAVWCIHLGFASFVLLRV